jgi:TonB family protein
LGVRSEPLATDPQTTWWESPFVLALAGAIAIHLMIGTAGDALVVFNPLRPDPPLPPKLELVDVEVPPVVKPPPPPLPHEPEKTPEPLRSAIAPQKIATHAHSEPPPPDLPPAQHPDEGGAPVVAMPDVAPGATGVAVAKGPINQHVGRGGTGTGTGVGTGSGSEPPPPMSVATIKTRALPRSDYSYEESKDYPAEAKQLSIGGKIKVKLIVDAQGNVKSATLLNRLGHGLDELALSRANLILFNPAKDTDDKPVASVVVWTFDMNPPK